MRELKDLHPAVSLLYFTAVLCFSCFIMHPVCLAISVLSALAYLGRLKGRKALRSVLYVLPASLLLGVVNPLFNHEGVTVLCYLPGGNPLTLESAVYGLCSALMLAAVILWFSCFGEVMTSDKLGCLFGKLAPALALVFSMTLRFVPRFKEKLSELDTAQKAMGKEAPSRGLFQKASYGITLLSALVSWALEGSVQTADSMRARGSGLSGKTSYSIFRMDRNDFLMLVLVLLLSADVIAGSLCGALSFSCFPKIRIGSTGALSFLFTAAYAFLCMLPIVLDLWEVKKWKALQSKI